MNSAMMPQTVSLRELELNHRLEPWDPSTRAESECNDDVSNSDENSSSSSEDSCQSDFTTPLEYARTHGLCRSFDVDNLLDNKLIPFPSSNNCNDLRDVDIAFLSETERAAAESLRERLDVDAETAAFLSSVLELRKPITFDVAEIHTRILRKLKMDSPILKSDHELEMHALRVRNTVKLSSKGIQPFRLRSEKDEGPTFPSIRARQKREVEDEIAAEKLDVDGETVEYLRNMHKLLTQGDIVEVDSAYATWKARGPLHVSPPLLPVSPPYSPSAPPFEAMQITMTSTPEDLIARDAAEAARELLQDDEADLILDTPTQRTIKKLTAVRSSSSPLARKRLRNLKLETPLTPRMSEETPPKRAKRVAFPEGLVSLIPQPEGDISAPGTEDANMELNTLVGEILTPFAKDAMYEVQNEKLSEVDTTMRVRVPNIAAVVSQAPWEIYSDSVTDKSTPQPQRLMLRYGKGQMLKGEQRWSGISKLDRLLPWRPFPLHLGKADVNEEFDDGSLDQYLAELRLDEEADLVSYEAMNGGLRWLADDESDDNEVQPIGMTDGDIDTSEPGDVLHADSQQRVVESTAVIRPPVEAGQDESNGRPSMLTLLRKKQLELESGTLATASHATPLSASQQTRKAQPSDQIPAAPRLQTDGLIGFLRLQGKSEPPKHKDGTDGTGVFSAAQNVAPAAVMVHQVTQPQTANGVHARLSMPLPVPGLAVDSLTTTHIVVTSNFLVNRQRMRLLQSRLPNLELIERDVLRAEPSQVHGSAQEEADLTLSSSTGLVTTTLQKLKQKPLPGQVALPGIRDRIAAIAPRYEQLLVLVSEHQALQPESAGGTATMPLDQRDCTAMAELTMYTALLQADVQVIYIAGGEKELVDWIAAAITRYSISDGSVLLLQDETLWERFLRKAGLNAIAAQTVLVLLKLPEELSQSGASSPATSPGLYGLAAFLAMSPAERVSRFGRLLGGEKVLRRVSMAVDTSWVPHTGEKQDVRWR